MREQHESKRSGFEVIVRGRRGSQRVYPLGQIATTRAHDLRGSPDALLVDLGTLGIPGLSGVRRMNQPRQRRPDGSRGAPLALTCEDVRGIVGTVRAPDVISVHDALQDILRALSDGKPLLCRAGARVVHADGGRVRLLPNGRPAQKWADAHALAEAIATGAL